MSITFDPTPTTDELNAWLQLITLPATDEEAGFVNLDIDALVAREAERLDRLFPGWAHRVNIDTLNLNSGKNCILAQGAYKQRLFRKVRIGYCRADDMVDADAKARGEIAFDQAYFSNGTRDAWINEIKRRYA